MTTEPKTAPQKPTDVQAVKPGGELEAALTGLPARLRDGGLSVGRIVEYIDRMGNTRAAIVAHVYTEPGYLEAGAVSLAVIDRDGSTYGESEVPYFGQLVSGRPSTNSWRWMPRVGKAS